MKKKYERPEAQWISFQLSKELAAGSEGPSYTEGGGTNPPWDEGYQLEDGPGAMD